MSGEGNQILSAAATTPPENPNILTEAAATQMKVAELKEELKKRGQGTTGNKPLLLESLLVCLRTNLPATEVVVQRDNSLRGLDVAARWELLLQNPMIPVPEPSNQDNNLQPPSERYAPITPKYKHGEVFVHSPFLGTMEKLQYERKRTPCRK